MVSDDSSIKDIKSLKVRRNSIPSFSAFTLLFQNFCFNFRLGLVFIQVYSVVSVERFELPTSSPQTKRATRLRYTEIKPLQRIVPQGRRGNTANAPCSVYATGTRTRTPFGSPFYGATSTTSVITHFASPLRMPAGSSPTLHIRKTSG